MKVIESLSPVKRGSEKNFGLVFFVVFLFLGIITFDYQVLDYILFLISISFLIIAFTKPNLLKFLNVLWFNLGMKIGGFIAPIVMFIVYALGILPIGILFKILRIDLLYIYNKNPKSFWVVRTNKMESLKKQY